MALPQDLRERTLAYLYREVDLAVVYPDHYTRASLLFGGEAGTIPGELAATATQFWSWPLQLLRGPLRREWSMGLGGLDRKSTRLNSSHVAISYAVFCLQKK